MGWLTAQNTKRGRRVDYSVGFAVTDQVRTAITTVPSRAWTPAIDAAGDLRDGGDGVEA